ncbi:MAG: EF-hand domain-containing protein [Planctomycetota bacterium]
MRERSDSEFDRKDLDSDGQLSLDEFLSAPKWSDDEKRQRLREDFGRLDKDADGEISRDQYIQGKTEFRKQYAEDVFDALDQDNDGILNADEYSDQSRLLNVPRVRFQKIDSGRDGKISLTEFLGNKQDEIYRRNRQAQFERFNADRDDFLSFEEYEGLFNTTQRERSIARLPEEQRLLAAYDTDDSKTVSEVEFLTFQTASGHSSAYSEMLFATLDRDQNGSLQRSEINRLASNDRAIEFSTLDLDASGSLTLSECIGGHRGKSSEERRRSRFLVRDFDQDGELSLDEFVMKDHDVRVAFVQRDINKDGLLTLQEQLAGVEGTDRENQRRLRFRGRDLDRDENVTRIEWVLPDTDPRVQFARRDADGDDTLTLEEHLAANVGKPQAGRDRSFFRSHDFDRDGKITFAEYSTPRDDVRVKFGLKDTDTDGTLSQAEFLGSVIGKEREPRVRRLFELHDQDQDGKLTLQEFTLTDERAAEERRIQGFAPEERKFARLDKSYDHRLTYEEFASRRGDRDFVESHEKRLFRTLDANLDGALELNEFLSLDDAIPQVEFAKRDTDGNADLTFDEYSQWMSPGIRGREKAHFQKHDGDGSDSLSVEEFVRLKVAEDRRQNWAWLSGFRLTPWGSVTALVVMLDVVLVALVLRGLWRRLKGKSFSRATTES